MSLNELLIQEVTFYASFHANPTNVLIHQIFVPLLFILHTSDIYWLQRKIFPRFVYTKVLGFEMDWAMWAGAFYCASYLKLSLEWGLPACIWVLGTVLLAQRFLGKVDRRITLAAEILSWGFQFYGHGAFEHRKPALLDALFQSVVLAPLFIFAESVMLPLGVGTENWEGVQENVAKVHKAWAEEGYFNIVGRSDLGVGGAGVFSATDIAVGVAVTLAVSILTFPLQKASYVCCRPFSREKED